MTFTYHSTCFLFYFLLWLGENRKAAIWGHGIGDMGWASEESIERYIEDQAFSLSYDLAPPRPPPPSPISKLDR
jgi:hypothetical protein